MRMNEIAFDGQRPIDGYGPGGFRIGGIWSAGSLILTPNEQNTVETAMLGPGPIDALPASVLDALLASRSTVDVVLVGQGAAMARLNPALRRAIEAAGLGIEHMSTPSACRTYNVMLAEGRRVAAVLVAL